MQFSKGIFKKPSVFEKCRWKNYFWSEKVSFQSISLLQAFLNFRLFPVQQRNRAELIFYWWDKFEFGMI